MRAYARLGLIAALVHATPGCVEVAPSYCAVGSNGCACTAGGGCDPGLACEAGECVSFIGEGEAGEEAGGETFDSGGDGFEGSSEESFGEDSFDDETLGDETFGEESDETFGDETGPPEDHNLVFISSATYNGNLGGLSGADATCQQLADEEGFSGTFVAWLSGDTQDAFGRLAGAEGWVRPDGRAAFANAAELAAGRSLYPPLLDQTGDEVNLESAEFWSGTDGGGGAAGTVATRCDDWTNGSSGSTGYFGEAGRVGASWAQVTTASCGVGKRLLCLQIDEVTPVAALPGPGKLAFVSEDSFLSASGRESADSMCAMEAADAGLSGTFLALLTLPGETAFARFDLTGSGWQRVDGVQVLPGNIDITRSVVLDAPLYRTAAGGERYSTVYTGAPAPFQAGNAIDTCMGWTDNSTSSGVSHGLSDTVDWWGGTAASFGCDGAGRVYCFEQ